MIANYCGKHDCFDCYYLVELGQYGKEVSICLLHKIQIVPADGLSCAHWRWEEDGPDNLHDHDAVECNVKEDVADLHHKE